MLEQCNRKIMLRCGHARVGWAGCRAQHVRLETSKVSGQKWVPADRSGMDRLVKHVRVVGEGMSGLPAARGPRRHGHGAAQRSDVGGQWPYDPSTDGGDPLGARALVKVH